MTVSQAEDRPERLICVSRAALIKNNTRQPHRGRPERRREGGAGRSLGSPALAPPALFAGADGIARMVAPAVFYSVC